MIRPRLRIGGTSGEGVAKGVLDCQTAADRNLLYLDNNGNLFPEGFIAAKNPR